jgi:hypothetical protein
MPRDRQEIDPERSHIHRNLTHALRRIGVQKRAVAMADFGQLRERLNRAHLVVGVHHAHQQRVRSDLAFQVFRVHAPVRVHRQDAHAGALTRKPLEHLGN